MEGRDIIIIGQQAWDTDIGSNCKNIALEMSKTNRVLYVNSPLDRATKFKHSKDPKVQKRIAIINKEIGSVVSIGPNIWNLYPDCLVESINWINNGKIFDLFNRMNNRKFAKSIATAAAALGFKDYILFNDSEMFKGFYLKDFLAPLLSIYYSRDYMLGVDYWKKHGERLEPLLISKSDICIANSLYLTDYCKQYNANSFDVGQGCDLGLFENIPGRKKPAEFEGLSGAVIGYVGALQSIRLDIPLIQHIAEMRKDWTVVLVGPEDENFINSALHGIKNVIFTGSKPLKELSSYMQFFDVCINPQLVNEVTIGNYPRKVDEYLAMGKPVVATATRAMELFHKHVYLAKQKEDYIDYIELALKEDSVALQEKRKDFARSHSWKNSVNLIYDAVNQKINNEL
ncbi:putative teichuronic acid biosynthesis glycosyltransferase TuaH [compost metagenome]